MNDGDEPAGHAAQVHPADDRPRVIEIDLGSTEQPGEPPRPDRSERSRKPRRAPLQIAAAVIAGALAGFVVGNQAAHESPSARAAAPDAAATVNDVLGGPLVTNGNVCAIQTGAHRLELGGELTNRSSLSAIVSNVDVVVPGGGLSVRAQRWGACGQLPSAISRLFGVIPAGASAWYAIDVDVDEACPAATPVEFNVTFSIGDQRQTSLLDVFPDLGDVTYSGCTTFS